MKYKNNNIIKSIGVALMFTFAFQASAPTIGESSGTLKGILDNIIASHQSGLVVSDRDLLNQLKNVLDISHELMSLYIAELQARAAQRAVTAQFVAGNNDDDPPPPSHDSSSVAPPPTSSTSSDTGPPPTDSDPDTVAG